MLIHICHLFIYVIYICLFIYVNLNPHQTQRTLLVLHLKLTFS